MKSRGVRVLLVILAVAALAAAGAAVWQLEQRIAAARSAADTFERDARLVVVGLGDLRAAQQAYVADGQPAEGWQAKATAIGDTIAPKLQPLRAAAGTVEAQAALESSIEAYASFMQSDARARDFVKSGQRLSASDVIFTEAAPILDKVINGIDTARGQESVARAVALERWQQWQALALGSAAAFTLLVLLLLVPIPRVEEAAADGEAVPAQTHTGGLNLGHDVGDSVVRRAQPIPAAAALAPALKPEAAPGRPTPRASAGTRSDEGLGHIDFDLDGRVDAKALDLTAVADLCSSLARVQDTRELQGLLERTAKALNATGVIIWMPDGAQGSLRPVLAHGYAPLALSRMGIIHPAADNATATAYRTKSVVVVPAEVLESGAVVAPLITAEGCSGAMAVELREGVETTPQVSAVATIVAAQLATLLTPGATASAQPASPPASAAGSKA